MERFKTILIALLIGTMAIACGGSSRDNIVAVEDIGREVARTKQVLSDAGRSAERYGQDHLGHYLKLTKADLRAHGLNVPDGISVELRSVHTSYCIRVTNHALPSIHPWRIGSVALNGHISNADRCRR